MMQAASTMNHSDMRMKIERQTVHHETSRSALIRLTPDQRHRPLCHDCGAVAATVHSQG
jgi:hypothetical protein